MKVYALIKAIALLAVLGSFSLPSLANEEFTPSQQLHIQQVVHDYLVSNPEVLVEASQSLQQQQMNKLQQQTAKVIEANKDGLFHAPASPRIGAKNSDITIVEFFDYQCGYCRKMEPVIAKLLKDDNQISVIYKQLPIFGEGSIDAAKLSLAAQQQGKFIVLHQALMAVSDDIDKNKVLQTANSLGLNTQKLEKDSQSAIYEQELQTNHKLANSLNIMGTPALIIAKTRSTGNKSVYYYLPTAARYETLQTIVSHLRQAK